MNKHDQYPESNPKESPPSQGVARKAAAWLLAPVIALGVSGDVALASGHENPVSMYHDAARTTIANQRFQKPQMESVMEVGKPTIDEDGSYIGEDTLKVTLRLPDNPAAISAMKHYENSNAVQWRPKPGVGSAKMVQDKNGKYIATGPGFDAPSFEELNVEDGTAVAVFSPHTDSDPVGDKVALYVTNTARTDDNGHFVETYGMQYVGAVELVKDGGGRHWVAMAEQPQLPDETYNRG
jgi:hypothetical protein